LNNSINNYRFAKFDIEFLDATFHLQSIFPRPFLRAPLGVPSWDQIQKKIILGQILNKNSQISYSQAMDIFEKMICQEIGSRFCIGTSTGRDAIKLSLLAMGLKTGDRVILPDFCCLSVLTPVLELGLVPVFADVASDLQLDPKSVQRVMQEGDKVLIVPHLFGGLAPMGELIKMARDNGTMVIDDAAQAIGLKHSSGYAGSGGDCGILSFGLFKPVSAMGGGAFITDDEKIYKRAKTVIKNTPGKEFSTAAIVKIYLKMVWRRWSYALFLVHRWRQQRGESQEPIKIFKNQMVGKISKFDAMMVVSQLKNALQDKEGMKKSAFFFASRLKEIPYLASLMQKEAVGFPRWPVEFVDSKHAVYPDFFKFMLKHGIEVQAAYRPLHSYIKEMGVPLEGEYKKSLDLYNKVVCFPFDSKKNDAKILSCLEQFSAKVQADKR